MSERGVGEGVGETGSGWSSHWSVIWFHVIGAAVLTLPQLLLGGDNTVCSAWGAVNMAGTENLGCASKTYLALLIMLSALWLTIFAMPTTDEAALDDTAEAKDQNIQMAGLTARFAVFFAGSMIFLETVAYYSI